MAGKIVQVLGTLFRVCFGRREGHQQEPNARLAHLVCHSRKIGRPLPRRVGEVATVSHDQEELEQTLVGREVLQVDCDGIPKVGTIPTQVAQIMKLASDF